MSRSHIIAACRSPVAPRNTALSSLKPHELAAPVITDLLARGGVSGDQIGELVLANALGAGGNPARIAALAAGLPEQVAGLSIDRQCAGGLDAILLGDALIRSGLHDVVIAGGAESYSRRPIRMHRPEGHSAPIAYDQAPFTPWPERDPDMIEAADILANRMNISRITQDEWACESHAKALAARDRLKPEITAVAGLEQDRFTRALSLRHCAKAAPLSGTITAANMAVAADGAAFVLMVSDRLARRINVASVAVVSGKTLGADPVLPGIAPIPAIAATLAAAKTEIASLSTAEIMEAFAVQAIACQLQSGIPLEIINQRGGALARGHPIGASGAILAVRLFHDLTQAGRGMGLAAIASAGGLGSALLLAA